MRRYLLIVFASCGWFHQAVRTKIDHVEAQLIDCAKQEADALTKGVTVKTMVLDVVTTVVVAAVKKDATFTSVIDAVIVKYKPILGEATDATIACVINGKLPSQEAESKKDKLTPEEVQVRAAIDQEAMVRQWHFR